jgi:formylglycine-generating enzyme required for sulfatase activity
VTETYPACKNDYLLFDMSGNLWEWVEAKTPEVGVSLMYGGDYSSSTNSTCTTHNEKPPLYSGPSAGFRCCL